MTERTTKYAQCEVCKGAGRFSESIGCAPCRGTGGRITAPELGVGLADDQDQLEAKIQALRIGINEAIADIQSNAQTDVVANLLDLLRGQGLR